MNTNRSGMGGHAPHEQHNASDARFVACPGKAEGRKEAERPPALQSVGDPAVLLSASYPCARQSAIQRTPPSPLPQGAVTRVVCPPGPPVYEDSCTAARTSGPGGPRGREALGAPRGPSNRPPRHRGRQVQPRAAPPVPVQSGSADRPQSCVEHGHPLPSAVVGDQRHVSRPGGGVSRPTTPPVGSVSGSPSLPTGAWSTRRHTSPGSTRAPHTQARRHLPPACATAGYGGGHQSGRP